VSKNYMCNLDVGPNPRSQPLLTNIWRWTL